MLATKINDGIDTLIDEKFADMKQDLWTMRERNFSSASAEAGKVIFDDEFEKIRNVVKKIDMRSLIKNQSLRVNDLDLFGHADIMDQKEALELVLQNYDLYKDHLAQEFQDRLEEIPEDQHSSSSGSDQGGFGLGKQEGRMGLYSPEELEEMHGKADEVEVVQLEADDDVFWEDSLSNKKEEEKKDPLEDKYQKVRGAAAVTKHQNKVAQGSSIHLKEIEALKQRL